MVLAILLSSVATAESENKLKSASIDSANAALIKSIQDSVEHRDNQILNIVDSTYQYKQDYYKYIQSTDRTLALSDSQIHSIAWSGGKLPLMTDDQANQANQLAMKYLAEYKLCVDTINQDNSMSYPSFIDKPNHNTQECA